jgi:hypothetical protein
LLITSYECSSNLESQDCIVDRIAEQFRENDNAIRLTDEVAPLSLHYGWTHEPIKPTLFPSITQMLPLKVRLRIQPLQPKYGSCHVPSSSD